MSEPRVADPGWGVAWCRGQDAVTFLQGLLSADLEVPAGSVVRSFLLTPQGKLTAVLWLLVGEDEVGMVCHHAIVEEVAAAINRFRNRVAAELEVATDPVRLVVGERRAPPGRWARDDGSLLADVSRLGVERTIVIGPPPGGAPMAADEYEAHRIRQGEPVVGRDVDERTIPQETGLVPEAVSFTKGCYLGQELVARIDTRGHVNERLMLVESTEGFAAGDAIEAEGRTTTVTSAADVPAGTVGLASVRREIAGGSVVTIHAGGGAVAGTVYDFGE